MKKLLKVVFLAAVVATAGLSVLASANELNVYSARNEALIKPALEKFTQQTGIKVNLITGKADGLISRMKSEGQFSPADVLITTDVGRLERAKQMGLTKTYSAASVKNIVPSNLRDPNRQWTALTLRARPIMYAKDRVDPKTLSTMAALTAEQWKNKICIRSSSNVYNQSMLSAMIALNGESDTLEWAQGLVNNFARPPKGGDRDQIKAVAAGQCDVAIANTYYLAGMLNSADKSEVEAASKLAVFWPDQATSGAHINISGIAIAKHAKNVEQANQLIDYMLTDEAQAWYASVNHEYPVKASISLSQTLQDMGDFKAQEVSLQKVGSYNERALKLMDKAGWK